MGQAAIAGILANASFASVLPTVLSVDEIREYAAASDVPLTADEATELEALRARNFDHVDRYTMPLEVECLIPATAPGPPVRMPPISAGSSCSKSRANAFAQQGFHATSMDEIAEAAGVTKPVLYQHFPSKRALYVELLEETGRQLLGTLAEATARAASLRDRVELGFRAFFRFAVGHRSAFLFLLGTSLRSDPEFARIVEEILDAAAETIADADRHPRARRATPDARERDRRHGRVRRRRALRDPGAVVDGDQLAEWISELAWFGFRGVRTTVRARRRGRTASAAARARWRGRNPSRARDARVRASARCSRGG